MREKLRARRPSPAMIVSVIALVFALAGTGIASVATISALSKKDKKKVKNIAKNQADTQITARAPGLSVKHAGDADSAGTGTALEANGSGTTAINQPYSAAPNTLLSLSLPGGRNYLVTADTELIDASVGNTRSSDCFLNDDGNQIGRNSDTYDPLLLFPSGGVSITGISNGGTVSLACHSSGTGTASFQEHIVAIPIANVQ
jgi:hypothetical protein